MYIHNRICDYPVAKYGSSKEKFLTAIKPGSKILFHDGKFETENEVVGKCYICVAYQMIYHILFGLYFLLFRTFMKTN